MEDGDGRQALEILEDIVPVLRGLGDWDIAIRREPITRMDVRGTRGHRARFWADHRGEPRARRERTVTDGSRRDRSASLAEMLQRGAIRRCRRAPAGTVLPHRPRARESSPSSASTSSGSRRPLSGTGKPVVGAPADRRASRRFERDRLRHLESWMARESDEALEAVRSAARRGGLRRGLGGRREVEFGRGGRARPRGGRRGSTSTAVSRDGRIRRTDARRRAEAGRRVASEAAT